MAPHATTPPPVSHEQPVQAITVLASSRAVVAGRLTEATIVVSNHTGKITSIFHSVLPATDFPEGTSYTDYSPNILLPGLVDAHVHLNEPGRTEWEGFWTGTRAAAFGGVTTVIDMPLNAIPPTTTVENLKIKCEASQGKCWVDVGFYGGVIPGNSGDLKALVKEGVRGFKGFLCDSGVEEFPAVSSVDIEKALLELKDSATTLMFHAEMIPPISDSVGDDIQRSNPPLAPKGPLTSYDTFLQSRPPSFETCAVAEILSLAHLAPELQLHIVHLSAIEAIPMLRKARADGIKITAETCFHYLALAAEGIQEGDTRHKCCPPIRSQSNQDGLWEELLQDTADGVIQTVVSDHSPCTPEIKLLPSHLAPKKPSPRKEGHAKDCDSCESSEGEMEGPEEKGDFFGAWGGISSVGLGLPILWTEGRKRNPDFSIEEIVRWCCKNTAKQVGLEKSKGDIGVGFDADIVIFDDEAEFLVEPNTMLFRNKVSPYENKTLKGVVRETWLRGQRVFTRAEGFQEKSGPQGKLLLEPRKMGA
ncbi:Allantoinase [Alternaria tenuissima]|uniref:Allantoinase n=2 Tax=Alternaria alternata complex TaxID=187734 RepID=A0A4V1WS10_ALTAL|nr:Allantoinase [Alternaria tenuissima]RYN76930.1 Allantoinase [Alternaria alternata]RYO00886.1 Allantoinase [Alternaria tenuissima]RYO14792.1 Allantoinase [Alternaria tenuissima]